MEIRPHTTKKHRAIGYYLKIIRALIKSPKTPFKELYYADLFCGDGECVVGATGKTYDPPIIQSILKPASRGEIFTRCFLNDLDPVRVEKMKKNTSQYSNFIDECNQGDANTYYAEVLKRIPPDQLSIFFLDPTNHKDLKWSTIRGISKHQHIYYDGQVRRPEMILTLMTYTMLNHYRARKYETINESLGTEDWLDEIRKNKGLGIGAPVETAFLNIFQKQLEGLGYKVPAILPIENIYTGNAVYHLFWASNESGSKVIQKGLVPYFKRLMIIAQKEIKVELKKAQARKAGIPPLERWIQKL